MDCFASLAMTVWLFENSNPHLPDTVIANDAKHRTSDVQLHIGESRDSGFALARDPE